MPATTTYNLGKNGVLSPKESLSREQAEFARMNHVGKNIYLRLSVYYI